MHSCRLAVAILAMAAAPAFAATPFDGTWKADLKASKPSDKPSMILVKDGTYSCDCATPPISVKADGQFHKVTGHPYYDEYSVKVVSPHEVVTSSRKNGKMRGTDTRTLSADGKMLTDSYVDMSQPDGQPVKGTSTSRRAGPAPAGALPISGSWVAVSDDSMSDAALTQTMMVKGKTVSLSTPTGISYDAPLDGTPVPIKGDTAGAMASLKMTGPRTLVETDTVAGQPLSVSTMTVRPDGKTMDVTFENKRSGRIDKVVIRKI